jgi:anti-sigma-K factor RskA
MRHKLELKVQAWMDGELPERESRRIGQWIARDPEAGGLAADLGRVRQAMLHNEKVRTLPETREFCWSKIERQIQREFAPVRRDRAPWHSHLRRWLAPMAGVAALAVALVLEFRQTHTPTFDEITATGDGMEALTFHDQSAHMTVVWLQDNGLIAPENQQIQNTTAPVPDDSESGVDLE